MKEFLPFIAFAAAIGISNALVWIAFKSSEIASELEKLNETLNKLLKEKQNGYNS